MTKMKITFPAKKEIVCPNCNSINIASYNDKDWNCEVWNCIECNCTWQKLEEETQKPRLLLEDV